MRSQASLPSVQAAGDIAALGYSVGVGAVDNRPALARAVHDEQGVDLAAHDTRWCDLAVHKTPVGVGAVHTKPGHAHAAGIVVGCGTN